MPKKTTDPLEGTTVERTRSGLLRPRLMKHVSPRRMHGPPRCEGVAVTGVDPDDNIRNKVGEQFLIWQVALTDKQRQCKHNVYTPPTRQRMEDDLMPYYANLCAHHTGRKDERRKLMADYWKMRRADLVARRFNTALGFRRLGLDPHLIAHIQALSEL